MPESLVPRKVQSVVLESFNRSKKFVRFQALLIGQFVGQYYRSKRGIEGEEPINLMYNAVRALVPNLVMRSPINRVTTDILEHKEYAELLGLALDFLNKKLDMKSILRASIVDALFMMGIVKVGLGNSDTIHDFGDVHYDNGSLFNERINFEDFVFDPTAKDLRTSAFFGDVNRVPRQILLDNDNYDHDAVMKLAISQDMTKNKAIERLSGLKVQDTEMRELQDFVDVVELWIPDANAKIVISDPRVHTMDGYLSATEYYGPDSGPYSFLRLSPPVPGNPYPISPLGVSYDLHMGANRMMVKAIDQADSQKDVIFYESGHADEAEDLRTCGQNEVLAGDPKSVAAVSVGGQNEGNIAMLSQLQVWCNHMFGGVDQLAGQKTQGGGDMTATQSSILNANSTITIEDSKDIINDFAADINWKNAWYLHTDPLIELPLVRRKPGGEEEQLILTPEQRSGDFLEYTFRIKARSLIHMDPMLKAKRVLEFLTNVLPGIMNTAVMAMNTGVQFNPAKAATLAAEEMGILDEIGDVFVDPDFVQKMQMKMLMGPQNAGKAGGGEGGSSSAGILQNGGPPSNVPVSSSIQDANANSQAVAAEGQSAMQGAF